MHTCNNKPITIKKKIVVYLVYICITSKNFENSETALKIDRMDVHCKIY